MIMGDTGDNIHSPRSKYQPHKSCIQSSWFLPKKSVNSSKRTFELLGDQLTSTLLIRCDAAPASSSSRTCWRSCGSGRGSSPRNISRSRITTSGCITVSNATRFRCDGCRTCNLGPLNCWVVCALEPVPSPVTTWLEFRRELRASVCAGATILGSPNGAILFY